jgi:hypothetical protein
MYPSPIIASTLLKSRSQPAALDWRRSAQMDHTIEPQPGLLHVDGHAAEVLHGLMLDPGKPFYQYVLTYLAASAGLTPVYDAEHYPTFMQGIAGKFPGKVGGDLAFDLADCVGRVRAGALPQQQAEVSLCCMLANAAYESIAGDDRKKRDPVFEVFRHVRNAASHGNAWHFRGEEPRFRGEWHGIVIDETRKGDANPLQGQTCFYGTLQPADLLCLIRDVEGILARCPRMERMRTGA